MPEVPYTLSDMANDGIGLLDALDIEAAHLARCIDGWDDRPDDGDRAPRAGAVVDVDDELTW